MNSIAISVAIAAVRIAGHKSEAFQAIAHLWVGLQIGIWLVGLLDPVKPNRYKANGWLVLALSVIEVACFVAQHWVQVTAFFSGVS